MKEFDDIELKIKELLEKVAQEDSEAEGLATGEWTKRIKSELCKLGKEMGFNVCASGCEGADDGEWLFDLIWEYGEGDPRIFREMPLAMECEWSLKDGEIWWDFSKLLVARAKYRVFIFNKNTRIEVEKLIDDFRDAIHNFKSTQVGDRYLLAGFCWDSNFKLLPLVVE